MFFFSSFKGKFELPKTKTYIRCCFILSPLSANLHSHIFFLHFPRRRSEVARKLGRAGSSSFSIVEFPRKCLKEGRTRAMRDTCEDSRSTVFAHSRLGRTAGLEKGSVIFLHNREEASALKKLFGISRKKTPKKTEKKNKILTSNFFLCIEIFEILNFFFSLNTRCVSVNLYYYFKTLVSAQHLTANYPKKCFQSKNDLAILHYAPNWEIRPLKNQFKFWNRLTFLEMSSDSKTCDTFKKFERTFHNTISSAHRVKFILIFR